VLEWAVHPASAGLFDDVLDWFEAHARSGIAQRTFARLADERSKKALGARGFADDPDHPWMQPHHRTLDDIKPADVPSGYKVRTVADYEGDITRRVAVHQRSWSELGAKVALDTYPTLDGYMVV
jgi:hypothetical protein